MWCLETIKLINDKAHQLSLSGKPERIAMKEVGIITPTRLDSIQTNSSSEVKGEISCS